MRFDGPGTELTVGLPPHVTAATGMDALTHNIESYLSPAYHPLCDGIALEGTRIAARALPGSGLGLAIVEQIVTQHGGSARAGRAESGGAHFELSLPLTAS